MAAPGAEQHGGLPGRRRARRCRMPALAPQQPLASRASSAGSRTITRSGAETKPGQGWGEPGHTRDGSFGDRSSCALALALSTATALLKPAVRPVHAGVNGTSGVILVWTLGLPSAFVPCTGTL